MRAARQLKAPLGLRTLYATWCDGHSLVPFGSEVRNEIERILGEAGVSVEWTGPDARSRVAIVLSPSDPAGAGWNLSPSTMGVFLVSDESATVFVFYHRVSAVLGLSSDSRMLRPEERRLLAKALGRVAVHELVHRMSPERSHASEGLMRERLGRSLLARERLPLDEESTRAFFSALQTEPRHLSPGRRPK